MNNGWYQSLRSAVTGKQLQILSLLEDEGRQHGAIDAESERLEKLLAPHLSSYAVDKVMVYTLLSRLYRSVGSDEEINNTVEAIMSKPSYSFHALRWYTLTKVKIPKKRIETLSLWAFDASKDWPNRFAAIMLHGAKGDLENFYDKNRRVKLIRELRDCQDHDANTREYFRDVFDWSRAMFCLREGVDRIIDETVARKAVSRHLYDVAAVFYPQEYFSGVLDAFGNEPESSRVLGRMQPALRESVEKLSAMGASNTIIVQLKKLLVETKGDYEKTCILLDAISSIGEFDIFFPVMFDYYAMRKGSFREGEANNVSNCLAFLDIRAGRNGVNILEHLRKQIAAEDDKERRDTMEQMIHDIENVRELREKRFRDSLR